MRRLALVLGGSALAAGLLCAQPLTDPWWRPLNPGGGSAGVTYGTQLPSLATTGTNPGQGELAIDLDGGPFGRPQLNIWDHATGVWRNVMIGSSGGTPQTIPVWNAAGTDLVDSIVTNVGDTIILTQTAGTFFIPDYLQLVAPFVSVGGVIPDLPNCVWADSNAIVFEGPTANAFENRLETVDVGQLQAVAIPDIGEAAGSFVVSLADGGAWDVGDSGAIWFAANTIWFEGTTADANENRIITGDPGAGGAAFYLPAAPSDTYAFLVSYMEGNTPQGANSIWANIGEIVMEGTAANDFEIRIMADIVGVDSIIEFASPIAGASSNLMRIVTDLTTVPMDGNDIVNGFSIELTNANHAGANNILNGINIPTIVGDAQATEVGLSIGAGWDHDIYFAAGADLIVESTYGVNLSSSATTREQIWAVQTTFNTQDATSTLFRIGDSTDAIVAMTGAKTKQLLLLDMVNSNHGGANNFLYGLTIDDIVEDDEAYEAPIFVDNGWDAHFVLNSLTAAPAENPPAGTVSFSLDDNVDYSGAGGNDCCLTARTSGGATVVIATIVLNCPCP